MTAADLGEIGSFPFVEGAGRGADHRRPAAADRAGGAVGEGHPGSSAADRRRAPARRDSGGSPDGPDAAGRRRSRLPPGDVDHRRGAVHPRSPGAPARAAGQGRCPAPPILERSRTAPSTGSGNGAEGPGSGASTTSARVRSGPGSKGKATAAISSPCSALELPAGAAESPVRQRLPADVPGRVPALPAGPGVAGSARPAQADLPRTRAAPQRGARAAGPRPHRRTRRSAVPRRARRSGSDDPLGPRPGDGVGPQAAADRPGVSRCPRYPVRDQPRLEPGPRPAAPGDGGRDRRDHPAVGADGRPDHAPSRSRRSAVTC